MFDQTKSSIPYGTNGSPRNVLPSRSSALESKISNLGGSNSSALMPSVELMTEKSSNLTSSPTNPNPHPYAKRYQLVSSPKAAQSLSQRLPSQGQLSPYTLSVLPSVGPSASPSPSTGASLRGNSSFFSASLGPVNSNSVPTAKGVSSLANTPNTLATNTGGSSVASLNGSNVGFGFPHRPLLKELSPTGLVHHSPMYTLRSPNRSSGSVNSAGIAGHQSSAGPSSLDEKAGSPPSSRGAGGRVVPLPLAFDSSNAGALLGAAQLRNGSGSGLLSGSRRNMSDTTAPPSPLRLGGASNSGHGSLNRIPSLSKVTSMGGSNEGSSDGITNPAPSSSKIGCNAAQAPMHSTNILSSATESMASSGFEVACPNGQSQAPPPTVSSFVGNFYATVAGTSSNLPTSCVYAEDHSSAPTVSFPHVPSPPLRIQGSATAQPWRLQHAQYIRSRQSSPDSNEVNVPVVEGSRPETGNVGINPSPNQHPLILGTQQEGGPSPAGGRNIFSGSASSSVKPLARHSRHGSTSPVLFAFELPLGNTPHQKRVGSAYSSLRSRSQSRGPYCLPVPSTRRTSSALMAPTNRTGISPSAAPLTCLTTTVSTLGHSPLATPAVLDHAADESEFSILVAAQANSASVAAHTEATSNVSGSVSRTSSCCTDTTNATSSLSPRIAVDGSSVTLSDPSGSPNSAAASPAQRRGMVPRHLGIGGGYLGSDMIHRTNTTTSQGSSTHYYRGMEMYQASMEDLMTLGHNIMANVTASGSGFVMGAGVGMIPHHSSELDPVAGGDTVRVSTSAAPTPTAGEGIPIHLKGRSTSAGRRLGGNVVFLEREKVETGYEEGLGIGRSRTSSTMTSGSATVQSSFNAGQHSPSPHSQGSASNLVHISGRKRSTGDIESSYNSARAQRTVSDMSMLGMADPSRLVRNDARKSIITKNAERLVDDADIESINNYMFEQKISSTKASTVYLAYDPVGDCRYAIKVLPRMALTNGWDSAAVSRVNSRTTPVPSVSVPSEPQSARRMTVDRQDLEAISARQLPSIATTPREGPFDSASAQRSGAYTSPFGGMPLSAAGYATVPAPPLSAKPTFVGSDIIHLDPVLEKRCREVAIMKEANCIYIVRLHEAILDPKHRYMYLVMEYVDGGRILKPSTDEAYQYERLHQLKAVRYAKQLITGLTFLHVKGIVHRDIKPENVLLDMTNDHVKLTDFGVSETVKEGTKIHPTSGGYSVAGTPMFLAPEAFGTEPFDVMPLDVWAFGVTVYALATGNLPFKGGSIEEVGHSVRTTTPVFPDSMHPALKTMCKRCLVKDPQKRITMGQLWYACLLPQDREAVGKQIPSESRSFFEIKRPPKAAPLVTNRGSLAVSNNAQSPLRKRSKRSSSRKENDVPCVSDAVARAARDLAAANTSNRLPPQLSAMTSSTSSEKVPEIFRSGTHPFNNEVTASNVALDVLSEDSQDTEDRVRKGEKIILNGVVSLSSDEGDAPRRSSTAMKDREEVNEVVASTHIKGEGLTSPDQTEITLLSRSGHNTVDSIFVVSPPDEPSPEASPKLFRQMTAEELDFAIPSALRDDASPTHTDDRRESMWSDNELSANDLGNGSFNFSSTAEMAAALASDWAASTTEFSGGLEGFVNGSFAFAAVAELLKINEPKVEVTDAHLAGAFVFAQPSTSSQTPRWTPESRANLSHHQHMETPSVSRVPSGLTGHKMVSTTDTTPRTRNSSIPPVAVGLSTAIAEYEAESNPMHGADIPLTPNSSRPAPVAFLHSPSPSLFTPRLNGTQTVPPSEMASPESFVPRSGNSTYPPLPLGVTLDSPTEAVVPPLRIPLADEGR